MRTSQQFGGFPLELADVGEGERQDQQNEP